MSTPYWGQLPPSQAGQTRARRLSDDLAPLPDRRQSLDAPASQAVPRSNSHRISVQTTKSDAPTDSTMSPFVSPTASSFKAQGLTPRPPSLPYGADQYPPELLENRRRRRSRNQEQEAEYAASADSAALTGPPPPAAPEAPRMPPSSSRYAQQPGPGQPYPYPQSQSQSQSQNPNMLEESAMPRPQQRVLTDPTLGRVSPGPNGRPKRTSAAEQSLQRSARRASAASSAGDRSKPFADVRSPLQRLELTLDSISKEDKRARAEAAERAARERMGGAAGAVSEKSPQQVRFHDRRTSVAGMGEAQPGTTPITPITPGRPGPLSQNPPDNEPRRNSMAIGGPSPSAVTPDSRIPAPIQVPGAASGIPQRNLSFRERAAKTDIKIPSAAESPVSKDLTTPTSAATSRDTSRNNSRKLKKNPPGDAWPTRVSEPDEIYNTGEVSARTPRVVGGPVTPITPTIVNASQPPLAHVSARSGRPPPSHPDLLDDDFADDFAMYPTPTKLTKTPSQRKADQILGRVPTQTGPRQIQQPPAFRAVPPGGPAAAAAPLAFPPVHAANIPQPGAPAGAPIGAPAGKAERHHVSDLVYHAREKFTPGNGLFQPTPYLDEWRKGTVGALSGNLLDLDEAPPPPAPDKKAAWWEPQSQTRRRSDSLSSRPKKAEAFEGEYDETNNGRRSPNLQAVIYPSIREEMQNGSAHGILGNGNGNMLSTSSFGTGVGAGNVAFEPQHLASRRAKARARRWDGLRPFSPSPSVANNDSSDSLGCFSLASNDAAFSRIALPYSSPTRFKPPLHLKCGPLLRYCGIRNERGPSRAGAAAEREFWRGSIMIVTTDADSSYDIGPILRLFAQPIELLPPPPREIQGDLAPEYIDPIAGHPKLGRKGETLYVRPVDHLEEGRDVSRDETDDGLFEKSKSAPEYPLPDGVADPPGSFAARRKRAEMDGEKAGKYKDIRGVRLHAERGYTFWRFHIEVELRDKQQRIAYRINRGPSTGFWVPARGQSMNIMFHSCNGFSLSANPDQFTGPDPMWRDVLNSHQSQPFHVMIGGGDQIYNDRCMQDAVLFKDWLDVKNPLHKHGAPFTPAMQDELERFYLERYAMWFSQGLFGMANAQIPMVNMYDDHDIIDGFGSYPHHFMNSPVFSGLGNVAFKYYMLFQHQSLPLETEKSEPSWLLGVRPGPYINELSRSLFMSLGGKIALLAVDARTERTREAVMRDDTWKKIMDRCYGEIDKGRVEHLLVLLGVPIAYPRLVWLENLLTSRVMDPVKALAKLGMFGGLLNRFDGGVEVLDDLDDHWTAKNHKHERSIVMEDLQDLAADKSIRVTVLSGDVHLAAVGQFYSNPKLGLAKHKDFRYIPNIISSAIVNTPPPDLLADVLNKRNKVHHFDKETDEDMIPIFAHGVDGKPRNNKHLLPHRNWCAIREYVPGHTPPPTPAPGDSAYDLASSRPGSAGGEVLRRRSSIFRRLSFSRSRTGGPEGLVGPKDRSRPPITNNTGGGLLRSLSRRAGAASADEVGRSGKPGLLKRTLSSSSVSSKFGGLFKKRNSSTATGTGARSVRDDGGINGVWGAESDEDDGGYSAPATSAGLGHPPAPGPGRIGLRGGGLAGTDYASSTSTRGGGYNGEYDQGDEHYFSVKPPVATARQPPGPVMRDDFSDEYHPPVPPKPVMTGAGGQFAGGVGIGGPVQPYQQQQQQQQQSQQVPQAQAQTQAQSPTEKEPLPNPFRRAPTTLSVKQLRAAKNRTKTKAKGRKFFGGGRSGNQDDDDDAYAVDLRGAIEVTLNVEISPRDPGGSTVPYRLVVPRLWYEYEGEDDDELGGAEIEGQGQEKLQAQQTQTQTQALAQGQGQVQNQSQSQSQPGQTGQAGMVMRQRGGEGGVVVPDEGNGVVSGGEGDGKKKGGIKRLLSLKRQG
ncbi:uncharacterized protein C8A04DRAFT_11218 [Dichotomopilus funicola]|uniref:PhoD-like phosphatase domain-containing protein n=1 Tax=Dichotomopilus funicola TaxID=1934379 RepID=A0AAN6V4L8_9PEZI|nr:hypothetical protein C8A04DRAFT_11218 [Dichotomopilus funicola]